jgi:hypothetical protein
MWLEDVETGRPVAKCNHRDQVGYIPPERHPLTAALLLNRRGR